MTTNFILGLNPIISLFIMTNKPLILLIKNTVLDVCLSDGEKLQRDLCWDLPRKQNYLNYLILGFITPPIWYVLRDGDQKKILDGANRINAIKQFMKGEFALNTIGTSAETLHSKFYLDFSPKEKIRFESIVIPVYWSDVVDDSQLEMDAAMIEIHLCANPPNSPQDETRLEGLRLKLQKIKKQIFKN